MKLLFSLLLLPTLSFAKGFVPDTFSANFEETIKSVATGKEKKSYGKIDYKYPGHIRFESKTPVESLFISNPQKSWYYRPPFVKGEKGEVSIQKSSNLPITKFLDSIKNGIAGSKLFKAKYEGKNLTLTFVPTVQKEMSLKEAILHAPKDAKSVTKLGDFEGLTLIQKDGKKVNLKFLDFKENAQFSGNHFKFEVPKDTKVSEG